MSDLGGDRRHGHSETGPDVKQRSEALKERIYVSFTVLAVTLASQREAEHATVGTATLTMVLTVLGTLLAVFLADVIAHMVRENDLPTRRELAHLLWVSFGSLSVIVTPLLVLGLSAGGVIELALALRVIAFVLVLTLVSITLVAVRRLRVSVGRKVLVLLFMSGFGLAVIAVELAAH